MILVLHVRMLIPISRAVPQDTLESALLDLQFAHAIGAIYHCLFWGFEGRHIPVVRHVQRL